MHHLLHILHNNLVGCIEFAGQFVNDDLDRGDAIAAFQNLEHDLIGQEQPLGWQISSTASFFIELELHVRPKPRC